MKTDSKSTTSKLGRRVITMVAALGLAGSVMAITSPGAEAAKAACPDAHQLCFWTGAKFQGRISVTNGSQRNLFVDNPANTFNNAISSIWNRSDKRVCVYNKAGFNGVSLVIPKHKALAHLGNYDNWISSIKVGC